MSVEIKSMSESEERSNTDQAIERMTGILADPMREKKLKKPLFETLSELENSGGLVIGIVAGLWGVGKLGKELTVKAMESHQSTIEGYLERVNDKQNPPTEQEMMKLVEEIDKLSMKIDKQSKQRERTYRYMITVFGAVAMVAVGGVVNSAYSDGSKMHDDEY